MINDNIDYYDSISKSCNGSVTLNDWIPSLDEVIDISKKNHCPLDLHTEQPSEYTSKHHCNRSEPTTRLFTTDGHYSEVYGNYTDSHSFITV